ncbi:DUF4041 domain-containing protein [uncultured Fibrella sp.]|uniref:DUF4041 domain-containing protein n=1 Tax=uncultured Fibrella sp. TaxID=1284596 RepID=UPI0035CA61C0
MEFFDFLKKKELVQIDELKAKIEQIQASENSLKQQLEAANNIGFELMTQLEKYKIITDIEDEAERRRKKLADNYSEKRQELQDLNEKTKQVDADYKKAFATYTRLRKEISLYESKLDIVEFGIYEPVYDFEKSAQYQLEQAHIIDRQKAMVSSDKAATCLRQWTVEGSSAKGAAVIKVYKKLMLRAFNGECDALIAKVKWNNVNQMKERMVKLFESINKLGSGFTVSITSQYLELKQKELILEHEYQLKRQQEKEELRAIQEELREEEKARREFEQAQREAEKEESNYEKALDKARREIELATGDKHDKLQAQIERLEAELLAAQEKKERALSMAQQTKRGHVYIISNIGSFGENVYKIGMTRRLEPLDRVKELGDASVPFQFDVHAMIYSDEARTLENELHKAFTNQKVNMLNYRKEFFNVSLDEIEQKIKDLGFDAEFVRLPEAMEYRETLAIIEKINAPQEHRSVEELIANEFPNQLLN